MHSVDPSDNTAFLPVSPEERELVMRTITVMNNLQNFHFTIPTTEPEASNLRSLKKMDAGASIFFKPTGIPEF